MPPAYPTVEAPARVPAAGGILRRPGRCDGSARSRPGQTVLLGRECLRAQWGKPGSDEVGDSSCKPTREARVGTQHTPADDIVYDLVSVQYHALNAAQSTDKYMQDAEEHDDVRQFFEECARHDQWRAERCHELLAKLTGGSRGLDAR